MVILIIRDLVWSHLQEFFADGMHPEVLYHIEIQIFHTDSYFQVSFLYRNWYGSSSVNLFLCILTNICAFRNDSPNHLVVVLTAAFLIWSTGIAIWTFLWRGFSLRIEFMAEGLENSLPLSANRTEEFYKNVRSQFQVKTVENINYWLRIIMWSEKRKL